MNHTVRRFGRVVWILALSTAAFGQPAAVLGQAPGIQISPGVPVPFLPSIQIAPGVQVGPAPAAQPPGYGVPGQQPPPGYGYPAQQPQPGYGVPGQQPTPGYAVPAQQPPPAYTVPGQPGPVYVMPGQSVAPGQSLPPYVTPGPAPAGAYATPGQQPPPGTGAPAQQLPPGYAAPAQQLPPGYVAPGQAPPPGVAAPGQPLPQQAVVAPVVPPAPGPTVAEMSFFVGSDVNPDVTGRPSPVIVRTYELKSLMAFNGADFFAMFEREKEIIGGDLIARDEWALTPGSNRQVIKNLQKETRYVGVVAAFRDLGRAQWRAATLILPNQTTRVEIRLDRNEVNVKLH